ncbi:nSTAND1 domain-containing NTPase [Catenuloplanes atrovinosus]|uniref:WD40 repeat protein n=1 Tax=Catenuloplanes atrovinosus TaxID=137266 RepID=A0AAE3YQ58_9ACTN|nr:trypsin-like peptidase domain-containing protein [Catenuloplanes atrovinosus]MDR7276617.1 WD40 repeat protein [Catenuloplanes atrovinosus]
MAGNGEPVAVARIRTSAGHLVGTGFLVASDLVLTCTHVVRAALAADFTAEPPADTVELEFPMPHGTFRAQGHVAAWTSEESGSRGDTALLRLTTAPPPELPVARLGSTGTARDEPVRIYGHALQRAHGPGDVIVGTAVSGRVGLLQINTEGGLQVEPGYSGSPVYQASTGLVVGMVVQRITGRSTCNAVPVEAVLENFPELAEPAPRATSPYRGLEPFDAQHAAWFKGREALTERLTTAITNRPLLILVGSSGSGKSSVIRAGLIPALRARGVEAFTERLLLRDAVENVVARLVLRAIKPDAVAEEEPRMAERLRTDAMSTVFGLAGALDERAGDGGLLFFVDQLEEAPPEAVDTALLLLDALVRTARRHPDGTVRVAAAVTLRAGFLEKVVRDESSGVVDRAALDVVWPMRREELRAAVRAGGVRFESGLDEVILADAGSEPGKLPLIEFTLELLWQRRRRHDELTLAAYERLGGVSGALATYADQVLDQHPKAGRERIRAVLTAMARPSDDGTGFRRRPLELPDHGSPDRAVIELLAARRLVVVTVPQDRPAYAEPAHQALLDGWPTLRGWLDEDREFLAWHDQVRADRRRWVVAGRDPDALLRGTALGEALRWTAERGGELGEADRAFVAESGARARRRRNLLRAVVAAVSVLALVAGVSAVVALLQNAELSERARAAASRQFASHSLRFRDTDPAKALQFAQAAWRADETPEAYGALLTQYARLDPVDRVFPYLWEGTAEQIQASDDGRVVTVTGGETPVVWTGLTGGAPQRVRLDGVEAVTQLQVDPSGRYVAGAADDGTVLVWDLTRPQAPRTLATASTAGQVSRLMVEHIAFSDDGTRLAVSRTVNIAGGGVPPDAKPDVRIWDLTAGVPVPSAVPLSNDFFRAYLGSQPGTVVFQEAQGVVLYDLASGRARASYRERSALVADNGAAVADCENGQLRVRDSATGKLRRNTAVACGLISVDSTTNAIVSDGNVVDLSTGVAHRTSLPPVVEGLTGGPQPGVSVVTAPDGGLLALGVRGEALYRTRPARLPDGALREADDVVWQARWMVTPDGRYAMTARTSGEIELSDAATGRLISRIRTSEKQGSGSWAPPFAFTPDSRHLIGIGADALSVYALPTLTLERRIPLPLPGQESTAPGAGDASNASFAVTGEDRVVVLHQGVLSWLTISTGQPAGPPLPLAESGVYAGYQAVFAGIAAVRPGHPHEIAVNRAVGVLEIWSLDQREVVRTLDVGPGAGPGAVVFDANGEQVAVATSSGLLEVWDVDDESLLRPVPAPTHSEPLGFTPEGYLIVEESTGSDNSTQVWDVDAGVTLAEIPVGGPYGSWRLDGAVLIRRVYEVDQAIPLDPGRWAQRLCELNDRPFTEGEREILRRDGLSTDAPCR